MTPGEMKVLIREHYEATTHRGDMAAIEKQVSPEFVDHDAPPGSGHGAEYVKKHIAALRARVPRSSGAIADMIAEDDRVAVRATWRGTHGGEYLGIPATNRTVEFTGMVFWRIERGRIAERWANIDGLTLMRQLL